jgi:hypothetical protein
MSALSIRPSEITTDPALQPRVDGIDAEHVRALEPVAEHWPPLKVVKRGGDYLLIDGLHRLAAARNLKLKAVAAEVLDLPANGDLHSLAFALNTAHGQPLTLSDRRAFAARLLRAHPDWSDRVIGRRSGLVQPTIAKVRQELERRADIPVTATRVGRDGRQYAAAPRQAREATKTLGGVVETVISAFDRTGRWQISRYLSRLADVLEEQDQLKGYETIDDAVHACRAVLGDDGAKKLAGRLGWSSDNILKIAQALGYSDQAQS